MATPQVVDELVVTLSLNAENYEKVEARVERAGDRTFRKQQDRARVTDRVNKDQQRRLRDVAGGVKAFATQVTAAVGIVTGLGVAVGGVLGGFLSFQTALRRQTVGTGLSNKEMQAWSATARRLGADANAGAEALANLAKEQRQGVLTGNAPTLRALGQMGVNIDPARSLQDILGDAQARYRAAPAGQRQQFEDVLSAQGVSADLILMIKSETDVREAFARSLSQATEENRKALDKLADAFESIKATSVTVAGTLLEALQPAIETAAVKLAEWATKLAEFTKELQDAGGGLQGFQETLDKFFPELGAGLNVLTGIVSTVANRFRDTDKALRDMWSWIVYYLNKVRNPFGSKGIADSIGDQVNSATGGQGIVGAAANWWRNTVAESRARDIAEGRARLPRNIENDAAPNLNPHNLPRNIENDGAGMTGNAQDLMTMLITQYGLTAQQAAAVVANWQRESGLRSNAYNAEGGGTGARGLAQWRGDRTKAFQARYGVLPDQASIDQQVEFAMTDPYERALMQRAFARGGDAQAIGRSYSEIYEAHGNVREDIRRGSDAQRLANTYGGTPAGTTVSIQNMIVQTPDAGSLVGGLQRLGGSQSYNTVIR